VRRTLWAIGIAVAAGCPVSVPSDTAPGSSATAPPPVTPPVTDAAPHAETAEALDPAPDLEGTSQARPVVSAFRRAIAALHSGDDDPIRTLVADAMRWTTPVARTEPRDRDAFIAALGDGITGPTRILDLGAGGFATQLGTTNGRSVLAIVEVADGRITGVRTYGPDPSQIPSLPPSAPPSSPSSAGTRGDASVSALASGRPNLEHVAVIKRVYEVASSRAWSKIEATVARGASHETHVDVQGAVGDEASFVGSLAALLGDPTAHLAIRKQHAVADWVLVEAVVGRGEGVTLRPVVGFVDVLRVENGRIAASARYLNHRPDEGGVSR
jgi:hypothetical protein